MLHCGQALPQLQCSIVQGTATTAMFHCAQAMLHCARHCHSCNAPLCPGTATGNAPLCRALPQLQCSIVQGTATAAMLHCAWALPQLQCFTVPGHFYNHSCSQVYPGYTTTITLSLLDKPKPAPLLFYSQFLLPNDFTR